MGKSSNDRWDNHIGGKIGRRDEMRWAMLGFWDYIGFFTHLYFYLSSTNFLSQRVSTHGNDNLQNYRAITSFLIWLKFIKED